MNRPAQTIVAIVALPPPTHGQAVVNQAIVRALANAGTPVDVLDTSPGELRRGIGYHLRRMRVYALGAIPALLRARGGLVYTVVEPGFGMSYNLLVLLIARIMRIGIVLHHHSALYTKAFDPRFAWLSRLAGRDALHVALDELMAKDIRAHYPWAENIVVAHNASHVAQPSPVDRSNRLLTCGFLSNLSLEKGLDTFLDCLRAARKAGLNLRAVLAGPPASEEAERMIADAKGELGDLLDVVGPVSGASKQAFFRSIDVFLFPTRYKVEGQPLVVLEAMSYGVPVITSRKGYCAELVGDAGVSAPVEDFEAAATAFLRRYSDDPDYRRQMSEGARKRYEMLKLEAEAQMTELVSRICASGLRPRAVA